jgi:hypothetical protein
MTGRLAVDGLGQGVELIGGCHERPGEMARHRGAHDRLVGVQLVHYNLRLEAAVCPPHPADEHLDHRPRRGGLLGDSVRCLPIAGRCLPFQVVPLEDLGGADGTGTWGNGFSTRLLSN